MDLPVVAGPQDGLNRTSVGLKLKTLTAIPASSGQPQSNQRGIETRHRHRVPRAAARLNRTSVGLKRGARRCQYWQLRSPQSNQRGIETMSWCCGRRPTRSSLNRTSVGLKRHRPGRRRRPRRRPQSNQRGIETGLIPVAAHTGGRPQSNQRGIETDPGTRERFAVLSLNRTSVGLKRAITLERTGEITSPQSNQRGIETEGWKEERDDAAHASIEPAWD